MYVLYVFVYAGLIGLVVGFMAVKRPKELTFLQGVVLAVPDAGSVAPPR